MCPKATGSCGFVETAFAIVHSVVRKLGQTYVRSVGLDVSSTRDKLPNRPRANTFPIQSKGSQISRLPRPVTNHNSRIDGALMHLSPRNAPAPVPYTSIVYPMGRDPRGFARRKLFSPNDVRPSWPEGYDD
jgi:hypothetical protein